MCRNYLKTYKTNRTSFEKKRISKVIQRLFMRETIHVWAFMAINKMKESPWKRLANIIFHSILLHWRLCSPRDSNQRNSEGQEQDNFFCRNKIKMFFGMWTWVMLTSIAECQAMDIYLGHLALTFFGLRLRPFKKCKAKPILLTNFQFFNRLMHFEP